MDEVCALNNEKANLLKEYFDDIMVKYKEFFDKNSFQMINKDRGRIDHDHFYYLDRILTNGRIYLYFTNDVVSSFFGIRGITNVENSKGEKIEYTLYHKDHVDPYTYPPDKYFNEEKKLEWVFYNEGAIEVCINYLIENYDYLNKVIDIYELWLNTEKDYKNRKDLKKRMSAFSKDFSY